MKYYVLALIASAGMAQSVSNTYVTDLNGRRVESAASVASDHQHTEIVQSLNGRRVPLEQTDERVLRQEGNTKVTERIVRKYDQNGQLSSTTRQVIEEQAGAAGSTTRTTTYRSDANGTMSESERETAHSETQGAVTRTQSTIERPGLNGSLQAVEKRDEVTRTSPSGSEQDATTFQRSGNGDYVVTMRQMKETTRSGNRTTATTSVYQPIATNAQLQLSERNVATTTTRADGSEVTDITYYGSSWSGNVGSAQAGPQLREQDVIERTPGPGGSVTQTISRRQPTPSDPNKLGPPVEISQTVCTGKCGQKQ